ncbi:M14 family metallopeptidase [Flagellimonas meishanensis]|uniref:M14 family metallopeptidase n=1 Tax=Flagellimonas meishanensis TaxID=2873264 RepID=UPI001CA6DCCC|nr:M14 metallopeptidase family protein [[Muricauda] meishanensis]
MIDHSLFKEHSVTGRYVTLEHLQRVWIPKLDKSSLLGMGVSVNGTIINGISLGNGNEKILMWSQMHGNESTTTKAVLDLVNYLLAPSRLRDIILDRCTLLIIPLLNPDGAALYTRENANGIDLNRDAKDLTQPESRVLRTAFDDFRPSFCFNLHDQRTIFSAGKTNRPATVSFLSPASDPQREVTPVREASMRLIVAMNSLLQSKIPEQVGRYDDTFNENCVGDTFQMLGAPTVLFEAGHSPEDYGREKTREYIFYALLEALKTIAIKAVEEFDVNEYFNIPENEKLYYDVLVKNAGAVNPNLGTGVDLGIQFKEVLHDGKIRFEPEVKAIEHLEGHFGHKRYDCAHASDMNALSAVPEVLNLVLSAGKR